MASGCSGVESELESHMLDGDGDYHPVRVDVKLVPSADYGDYPGIDSLDGYATSTHTIVVMVRALRMTPSTAICHYHISKNSNSLFSKIICIKTSY